MEIKSLIFYLAIAAAQNALGDTWSSSRPLLDAPSVPLARTEFPWLQSGLTLLTKSLSNPEGQRQVAGIQGRLGTSPQADARRFLDRVIPERSTDPKARREVSQTVRNFMEREIKAATLPQAWQKGLTFELGSQHGNDAEKSADSSKLRYGLILTRIEPNATPFRLASLASGEEYGLVAYAPKASMQYEVGPIDYEENQPNLVPSLSYDENSSWISQLPELRFKGKIVPRGPLASGQYIPPQTLILEQSQGFYAFELQTTKLVNREVMFHRFRVPLGKGISLKQERNQKFLTQRDTLENIYSGYGFSVNLDHFILEKRYQSTLVFRKNLMTIELNTHLPAKPPEGSHIWNLQRWELKLQQAF